MERYLARRKASEVATPVGPVELPPRPVERTEANRRTARSARSSGPMRATTKAEGDREPGKSTVLSDNIAPVLESEGFHQWAAQRPTGSALEIDNVNDLFMIAYPEAHLHTWQIEEQMRMSGYLDPSSPNKYEPTDRAPIREILVANNSAGKDSTIIAPIIAWILLTFEKSSVVLTSSSHRQLKGQTEKNIRNFADKINESFGSTLLEYKDLNLSCPLTGSECIMFATDKPGKVEGYHPIEPGRKMMVLLNEVKSIDEDILKAVLRCFGYTHWIEVSSAGLIDTHLHKSVKKAKRIYPEIPQPGESFTRTITVDDCPHISDDNKNALIEECGGIDSPIAQASLYSQFIHLDSVYVIPAHLFDYPPPESNKLGNKLRAGLDCALGGAEAVLCVFRGNVQVARESWRIQNEPALTRVVVEAFERHGLRGAEINVDVGGLGLPIAHRLEESGWSVNKIRNEAKPFAKVYRNRGTENWWTVRRLIQDRILKLLPDEKQLDQLKKRRYKMYEDNTLMVEPKREAAARGEPSPDRADALVLCFCNYSVNDIYKESISLPQHRIGKYIVDLSNPVEAEEKISGWLKKARELDLEFGGNLMNKVRNNNGNPLNHTRRRGGFTRSNWNSLRRL